jgi:hypothetical protein
MNEPSVTAQSSFARPRVVAGIINLCVGAGFLSRAVLELDALSPRTDLWRMFKVISDGFSFLLPVCLTPPLMIWLPFEWSLTVTGLLCVMFMIAVWRVAGRSWRGGHVLLAALAYIVASILVGGAGFMLFLRHVWRLD